MDCRLPIYADKDVHQSDDGRRWTAGDLPLQDLISINIIDTISVDGHDRSRGEVEYGTEQGSDDEQPASSDPVDEEEKSAGGDQEDDVLDDRRSQSGVLDLYRKSVSGRS